MSEVPSELKYTESHEWVRQDDDGHCTVGITAHAQELLGDMVYVELPEVEAEVTAGDETGVVESVKAASDVYAPINGEIVAVNETLADAPETINNDPYGDGWIYRVKATDTGDLNDLMSADEYSDHVDSEEH